MANRAKVPRTRRSLEGFRPPFKLVNAGEEGSLRVQDSEGPYVVPRSEREGWPLHQSWNVPRTSLKYQDEFDGSAHPRRTNSLENISRYDGRRDVSDVNPGEHSPRSGVVLRDTTFPDLDTSPDLSREGPGEDHVDMASTRPQRSGLSRDKPSHLAAATPTRDMEYPSSNDIPLLTPSVPPAKAKAPNGNTGHYVQELKHNNSQQKRVHDVKRHKHHRHTTKPDSMPAKRLPRQRKKVKDQVDRPPPDLPLSVLDLLGNLIGIGSYLFDVGTDCWVAYTHYAQSNWWWFGLTLSFVVGPSLVMTFFSTVWYIQESQAAKGKKQSSESDTTSTTPSLRPASRVRWVSRAVFLFLQIAPVLRYMDSIIFCLRSWRSDPEREPQLRREWYDRMLYEDTDATLLRLIECFMEAAPQLVLQLYIISASGLHDEWYMAAAQVLSCVTSLFSLSWALAAYHKALRLSLQDKANMSWTGVTLQFFWRLFTIGARILAMALFASHVSPWVFAVAVSLHWMVMLVWCLTKSTKFCVHRWQEPLFNMVMAVVYIFSFLNLLEGHTRLRYLIFYIIMYGENLAMVMVWYTMEGTNMQWFHKAAMVVILLGFFVGITLQMIYYKFYHPNSYPPWSKVKNQILCCISCSEMCNKSEGNTPATEIQRPARQQTRLNGQKQPVDTVIVTRGLLNQPRQKAQMV